jgi:hypothetical protein
VHSWAHAQVSWDARDGTYTARQLEDIFSQHGAVADVVLRQPKQKRSGGGAKGSAFVEMGSLEAAAAAARAVNGRPEQPLLVVPFSKARCTRLISIYHCSGTCDWLPYSLF